jgi:hypothetical protein
MEEKKEISRRELLKKGLKTAGYAIPAMMLLKMGSLNAWASNYGYRPPKRKYGKYEFKNYDKD